MSEPEPRGDRPAVPGEFAVVLLAAGASSRMGRPKLLLPWGATTVIGHLLEGWRALGSSQIAVILAGGGSGDGSAVDGAGPGAAGRGPMTPPGFTFGLGWELDRRESPGFRIERLINPDPARGMFSSIQVAARWQGWKPSLTHFLISLGDQPHVRESTWRRLLEAGAGHPDRICQPARSGRPRHPVLMPARHFQALATATEANLKDFLAPRDHLRHCFECDDPGLDLDLDYPADYEKALQLVSTP